MENGRIPAGFSRRPANIRRKVLPVLPFYARAIAPAHPPARARKKLAVVIAVLTTVLPKMPHSGVAKGLPTDAVDSPHSRAG
ncbi:hypothetical protein [Sphingomonas sp.]|uniref:hypothetical protein n=1 Tax=Sphingomonas sp. TaxID=28214 RepID=UPI0031D134E6